MYGIRRACASSEMSVGGVEECDSDEECEACIRPGNANIWYVGC